MSVPYKLHKGDCIEIMRSMPANSIDFILTDPPYKREFIYLYGLMAEQAAHVLKDGGLLIALAGHFALDEIIPAMSKHLKYWWIGGMPNNTGAVARNFSRQIMCSWKPALWYAKGKPIDHDFAFDMFKPKRIERLNHEWEQPVEWFIYNILKITKEGETVLDPFMGSGTTGVACKQTMRKFIGIEKEQSHFEVAEHRISQAQPPLGLGSGNEAQQSVLLTGGESAANLSLFPAEGNPPAKVTAKSTRR